MLSENNSALDDIEVNTLGRLIREVRADLYLLRKIFAIYQKLLIVSVSLADSRAV